MLTLLALLFQATATEPVTLKPMGKWQIDYGYTACTLSRSFGTDAEKVTVSFRPYPLGGSTRIQLTTPATKTSKPGSGTAALNLEPGSRTMNATYVSYIERDKNENVVDITSVGQELAAWGEVEAMSVSLGKSPPIAFNLLAMPAAVNALQKCQNDLLRSWQVDPGETASLAVTAKSKTDIGPLFDLRTLPTGALEGKNRRISMLFTIDIDGAVSECRIIETTAVASLDARSCALAKARMRYEPARNKSGQPALSHALITIQWTINPG